MKEKRAGIRGWLLAAAAVSCFTVFGATSLYAAKPKIPTLKIGATHHTLSPGSYTLTPIAGGTAGEGTGSLVGFALFAEKLFMDRFSAGFKYGYGLERNMTFDVGTNQLNVLESAAFWALEFKAFVRDNLRPGIKPFLGVSYGTYTVTSTITVIPASGSTSEDQTAASIPYTMLSVGADYTFGFGGIRLEVGQAAGSRNDLESSSTYYASYDYDGAVVGISVFSFF